MKKFLVLLILPMILLLASCQVKDLNGPDNYELATYTLEDIKNKKIDSNSSVGRVESGFLDHGFLKVKKFSGQRTIVNRKVTSGDKVTITSVVESGNLAIFVKCGDNYSKIPLNTEYVFEYNEYSGSTSIIVVGESARFRVDYNFEK